MRYFASLLLGAYTALADVPTNCMITDFWGKWDFNIGLQGTPQAVTNQTNYVNLGKVTSSHRFEFSADSLVTNLDTGSEGYGGSAKI